MNVLNYQEMEVVSAGGCGGQEAAYGIANASLIYATIAGGPIGFAIATTAWGVALYNLQECYDREGGTSPSNGPGGVA